MHLDAPIDFDAIDGAPVDLLFVLLVPQAATDAHLELLRQIASMLDRKEVREKLTAQGFVVAGGPPEKLTNMMKSESAKWKQVIEERGITSN